VVGVYSVVLGFFVPSGGGKWLIEAPYVMQAANQLRYHLGWTVQIYNAAEALPNLINPFWMLPVLACSDSRRVISLASRSCNSCECPLVLALLWILGLRSPINRRSCRLEP